MCILNKFKVLFEENYKIEENLRKIQENVIAKKKTYKNYIITILTI